MRAPLRHFNSIKVRLEPVDYSPFFAITQFQFHKGTIRTDENTSLSVGTSNFNSIKVRLERMPQTAK